MPWGPSPEYADWWYVFSWKGILWSLVATALAALAALMFTLIQFWSDGIREVRSNERQAALETQTSDAKRDTAKANERIAELQTEAERLKAQAESDRLARAKIEEKLAPRIFTLEQIERLVGKLKNLPSAEFDTASGEPAEQKKLMFLIEGILHMAGWKQVAWQGGVIVQQRPDRPNSGIISVEGVIVYAFNDAPAAVRQAADKLASLLTEEGIPAKAVWAPWLSNNNRQVVHILIGPK